MKAAFICFSFEKSIAQRNFTSEELNKMTEEEQLTLVSFWNLKTQTLFKTGLLIKNFIQRKFQNRLNFNCDTHSILECQGC